MNQYDRKQAEAVQLPDPASPLNRTCSECRETKRKIEFPRWSAVCNDCGGGDLNPKPGRQYRRGDVVVRVPKPKPKPSGRSAKLRSERAVAR